ncbi:hypothetical protein [Mycolicibacter icosiumassiliensis]|uniref:hypothetical protein n=1 Tax=Mycolicibacter icosiumassiliensis TaxID=1792835 RepID=UPI0008310712|nr:hypothetical protein [Mycolicibacter icosiumassiliensis]
MWHNPALVAVVVDAGVDEVAEQAAQLAGSEVGVARAVTPGCDRPLCELLNHSVTAHVFADCSKFARPESLVVGRWVMPTRPLSAPGSAVVRSH